jgi:hypothetical protein
MTTVLAESIDPMNKTLLLGTWLILISIELSIRELPPSFVPLTSDEPRRELCSVISNPSFDCSHIGWPVRHEGSEPIIERCEAKRIKMHAYQTPPNYLR